MKVLSIEQMTRLKELGIDVLPKGLCFMYHNGEFMYMEPICEDDMKAFSLQDVIELLPATLPSSILACELVITKKKISYIDSELFDPPQIDHTEDIVNDNILDAAYQMLIWVIENGYLKTK